MQIQQLEVKVGQDNMGACHNCKGRDLKLYFPEGYDVADDDPKPNCICYDCAKEICSEEYFNSLT